MNAIHVDHTLPAAQFNSQLLAASRLRRLLRVAEKLKAKRQAEAFDAALAQAKRIGFDDAAARELAQIHVQVRA